MFQKSRIPVVGLGVVENKQHVLMSLYISDVHSDSWHYCSICTTDKSLEALKRI
jgi:hypothetical protein